MSEKNIIKTARFHHITAGMRFAEFILRETEGLTQTPPLAELRIPAKTLAGILWRIDTVSLSNNPQFVALIECSRERQKTSARGGSASGGKDSPFVG